MTSPQRVPLVVMLDEHLGADSATVLLAALRMFNAADPVILVLALGGIEEPGEQQALAIQELAQTATLDGNALPEIVLLGASEAAAIPALANVDLAGGNETPGIVLATLLAARAHVRTRADDSRAPDSAVDEESRCQRLFAESNVLLRDFRRELRGAPRRQPHVVVLFQHRNYWGAVDTICEALARRDDLRFTVVAIDSGVTGKGASTAEFLVEKGYKPRSGRWLTANLDTVDAIVLDNPYDELRPEEFGVAALATTGVRLIEVPYGSNAMAGEFMDKLLWDLALQRFSWRAYLPSEQQRDLFAAHCSTGSAQVRVVGSAKADRVVRGELSSWGTALRENAKGSIFLWNPHFRVEPGGWSTFLQYVEPMLEYFATSTDTLVIRPHFRLFPDLARYGGIVATLEERIRTAAARHPSIVLDESPDYLEALVSCDAMISDLSSLATEFLPTGKPVLYLKRSDGPGTNSASGYFESMYQASNWKDVRTFITMVDHGEDPKQALRAEAVSAELGHLDGLAADRIATDIAVSLRREYAEGSPTMWLPAGEPDPAADAGPADLPRITNVTPTTSGLTIVVDHPDAAGWTVALESPRHATDRMAIDASGCATVGLTQTRAPRSGLPLPTGDYTIVLRESTGRTAVRPYFVDDAVVALAGTDVHPDGRADMWLAMAGVDLLQVKVVPPGGLPAPAGAQNEFYNALCKKPLQDTIFFTSFTGSTAGCNPLAIERELARRGDPRPRLWTVNDHSVAAPEGCTPVILGSTEWYEAYATSRLIVDNEALPAFVRKRPGQTLVQTWHGTPLKRLRWDIQEINPRDPGAMERFDRDAASWDFTLSPNPLTTEVLHRAFRVGGTVVDSGYPRNDVLADPALRADRADRTREWLGIPAEHQVVLYAPTWRDDALEYLIDGRRYAKQPTLDYGKVIAALGPDVTVLYRGHRYVNSAVNEVREPGVLDVSEYPDMADLLATADVLITDYSSSMFDFAITGRPMVFFAYDLEHYRDDIRGFYFDMETTVPGPIARTSDDVIAALTDLPALREEYADRYRAFHETYNCWDDGHAAERVVDAILSSTT